jgi:hypothetical protein
MNGIKNEEARVTDSIQIKNNKQIILIILYQYI